MGNEKNGEECSKFINIVEISLWILLGVRQQRYVRSNSIGLIFHVPIMIHFSEFTFLKA